jgi:hypothetical protein
VKSRSLSFLEALTMEHSKARECVAAYRCYQAFDVLGIRRSSLWNAVGTASGERLVMTLARVLDDDPNTITAVSVCRCIEQNPSDCLWAFSEDGRAQISKPEEQVRSLARKWSKHWQDHPLREQIKHPRDKAFAHLDKKHWLNSEVLADIRISEVESLLDDLLKMINEFRQLIDRAQVHDGVYAVVSHECALTMLAYEIGLGLALSGAEVCEKRLEQIVAAINGPSDSP